MRTHAASRSRGGFTLIELLVVIAIMSILASLITAAVFTVKRQAMVAQARSSIESITTALAAYHTLTGVYPHASGGARDDPEGLFRALYSANTAVGGSSQNFLEDWRPDTIGLWAGSSDDPGHRWERPTGEQLLMISKSYVPCVLLDPWGRPFHYVEWDSLPIEERRLAGGGLRAPGAAPFSVWSDGPDRTNASGEDDDVDGWSGS